MANAIFQSDSILDDLKESEEIDRKYLQEEMNILNQQLVRTGELLNRLFSMQYFETRSVTLFKEMVQISYFLQTEFDIYAKTYEHIIFENHISKDLGFIGIDRVQFQQVITNLVQNAIKFANKTHPKISIIAKKQENNLLIHVEDNGSGLGTENPEKLFEKYATGTKDAMGLGMGLYLCKTIIEMHG